MSPAPARLLAALLTVLLVAACGGGGGGNNTTPTPPDTSGVLQDNTAYSTAATAALASAIEQAVDTDHTIQLASGPLTYKATVGHLTAGTAPLQASMFYVAYSVASSAANAPPRPLIFFYNGGPGSASVWLHLGSWGPRRLVTNDPGVNVPLPYSLVDNQETLLAVADLVFVDAVGTGFSQAIAPATNASFWSVDADAAIFRDFIGRYLAKYPRPANTALVLYGESYGGLRTPIVAQELLAAGMALQGIVLQSPILNYNSNCGVLDPGQLSCGSFIPSYAATAAWFQLSQPLVLDLNSGLPTFADLVAGFVDSVYEPAAQLYITLHQPLGGSLNSQLAAFTGLTSANWLSSPLLPPDPFRSLLKPQQLLGRYDARMSAAVGSALAADGDPSSTATNPAFKNAIAAVLSDLKYQATVPYAMSNDAAIARWGWQHDGKALPDAIPDLALAMTLKPGLKTLALLGLHDLATPYHLTESDLGRLGTAPAVQVKRYVGGHMTYLDDKSRPVMRTDLGSFLAGLSP
nr:hypothetical protein [Pelomonas sp. KK5]